MKREHKEYLDKLRESGKINMFGAGAYLQMEFGMDKLAARKVLKAWMKGGKDAEAPADNT